MPEHSGSCRDEIGSGIQDGSHYVTWQCKPVAERHYLLPQHPHKAEFHRKCLTPRSVWCLLEIGGFFSRLRCGLCTSLFYRRSDAMLPVEHAIIEKLRSGPCLFDEVVSELSDFSWQKLRSPLTRICGSRLTS